MDKRRANARRPRSRAETRRRARSGCSAPEARATDRAFRADDGREVLPPSGRGASMVREVGVVGNGAGPRRVLQARGAFRRGRPPGQEKWPRAAGLGLVPFRRTRAPWERACSTFRGTIHPSSASSIALTDGSRASREMLRNGRLRVMHERRKSSVEERGTSRKARFGAAAGDPTPRAAQLAAASASRAAR